MSEDDGTGATARRQIGGELIIPVAALVFTLYYFWSIVDSPWTAQVNAFLVGTILIAVVAIFLISRARLLFAGKVTLGVSNLLAPYDMIGKRLGFIGLTVAYLIIIHWLGFTLTTFLFMWGSMMLLAGGKRPVFHGVIALIMAGVGWGVFIALFEERLPKGPVEHILKGFL